VDANEKKDLERQFDRELTDGEAAEIMNTPVLQSDERLYNNEGGLLDVYDSIPVGLIVRKNN